MRHIDRLERNVIVCDVTGKVKFRQYIAWHDYGNGKYHVMWWTGVSDQIRIIPRKDHYLMSFWVGDQLHCYRVGNYCETFTHHDPEVLDRDVLSVNERIGK